MMIASPIYESWPKILKILKSAKMSMPAANAMFKYLMIGNGSVTKIFFSVVLAEVAPDEDEELFIYIINK